MSQLFNLAELPSPPERSDDRTRTRAMHALARLKQFRAGRITLEKADIRRDLDIVFQFVEQVTA